MEAVQVQQQDVQDTRKLVNNRLNSISNSIRSLETHGFQTEQIYRLFDILRYDVLSDNSLQFIEENHNTEEVIKSLKSLDIALSDLIQQIKSNIKEREESEKKTQELKTELDNEKKPKYYKIYAEDFIVNTGVILATVATLLGVIYGMKKLCEVPETTEIFMDTQGNYEESATHYAIVEEGTPYKRDISQIVEFFPADESGFRKIRIYYLDTGTPFPKDYDLNKIDLSGLEYVESYSYNEEANNVSKGYYRAYQFIKNDFSKMGRWETQTPLSVFWDILTYTLGAFGAAAVLVVSHVAEDFNAIDTPGYFLYKLRENLGDLIYYKLRLSSLRKQIEESMEVSEKYGKTVNNLLSKVDELIQSTSDRISQLDNQQMLLALREARAKEAAANQERERTEKEKAKLTQDFKNAASIISNVGERLKELDPEKYKEFLHSIPITEEDLFEPFEDHLVIKEGYKLILPYLDLCGINFHNVDIRNIDWSKTNASILIQHVYNGDATGCIMGDHNLHNFQNYDSATLSGATLHEDPSTMIAYDKAFKDENTRVVPVQK